MEFRMPSAANASGNGGCSALSLMREPHCKGNGGGGSSFLPHAGKYLDRRPRHVDVVIGLSPLQTQVPTGKMGENLSVGSIGQNPGDTDRAGPGSACLRDS